MRVTAYIGLGSNLDDPARQLRSGIAAIAKLPHTRLLAQANWYQSSAVGPGTQPDYLNTVVAIDTGLAALALLRALHAIEQAQGRQRHLHWGPRTLDLDILLYGDCVVDTPELRVPHPQMHNRNFVLMPLADIAPTLTLPDGTPIAAILANCGTAGIVPVPAGARDGSPG